jgi:hypothetical protein
VRCSDAARCRVIDIVKENASADHYIGECGYLVYFD